jgi:glycosyltransferase involved in cell wall biosynthesis
MMVKMLVCVNPDLNLIDGSSIWAQAIALACAAAGSAVDFIAKSAPRNDTLFGPLVSARAVTIVDGPKVAAAGGAKLASPRLSAKQMADLAIKLDAENGYDVIIIRGHDIADALLGSPRTFKKVWLYLTDIPQKADGLSKEQAVRLRQMAGTCRRILCQSQGFIDIWRAIDPTISGEKISRYSPVVPEPSDTALPLGDRGLRACYAGKFTPEWMTLEMTQLWPEIVRRVPGAQFDVAGDKIHDPPGHPTFRESMQKALRSTPNVTWHGALSRQAVLNLYGAARVGLSWRSDSMDDTVEYSTKILEYGAAGCSVVLNRNELHEQLCGKDYPLYANSADEFVTATVTALSNVGIATAAAERMSALAKRHSFDRRVGELKGWLARDCGFERSNPAVVTKPAPPVILVAGHDLKFAAGLLEAVKEATGARIIIDRWSGHNRHDEAQSVRLLKQADVIFCEWCLGNIEWYAANRKSHQPLVARCHAQEANLPYLSRSNLKNIDHISFVGKAMRDQVANAVGIPIEKTSIISNFISPSAFTMRKKMFEADTTLGLLGMVPHGKRLDRAIDLLTKILEWNPDFRLRVKGASPFSYDWVVNRSDEVTFYREQMHRINSDPQLRYRVIFDPQGDDVDRWMSLVGFVVSPSDSESFHMAIGEGMLTGAAPLIWNWEGADGLWPKDFVLASTDRISAFLRDRHQELVTPEHRARMRQYVLQHHSSDAVVSSWKAVFEKVCPAMSTQSGKGPDKRSNAA